MYLLKYSIGGKMRKKHFFSSHESRNVPRSGSVDLKFLTPSLRLADLAEAHHHKEYRKKTNICIQMISLLKVYNML